MSENGPDNPVLNLLRHIRSRVDVHAADMVEVKERLGLLEGGVASLSRRVDRMAGELERVKRRLDLSDAPA